MKNTNKIFRMSKVISMALSFFIQIYWYKLSKKSNSQWDKLWARIGEKYRKTLFELEGLLIKVGQILSTRADILPKPFIEQIEDLTDNVPPSKWNDIEKILIHELGGSLDSHFLEIEKTAIASASIGEVYKGKLKNGKEVVIKVQRPSIQSIIQTDFKSLAIIIWFVNHLIPLPKRFINFNMLFQELKQVIERELDYSLELENQLYFKEKYKDDNFIYIPITYPELCTNKVLVMEWIEGNKISDIDDLNVDKHEIATHLLDVFLPQWLEPGIFHADPHPGNLLVSNTGKIILLDYGMVGEISKNDAKYFQSLIESLLTNNYSKSVEHLSQLGFLLPNADHSTIEKLLKEWMSFQPSQLKEIDLIALKVEMNDLIRALPIQVPTRFVFLGRSFLAIEGIIRHIIPDKELLEVCKPVFLQWLNKQGKSKWFYIWKWVQSHPLFNTYHSFTEFLQFPQKLEAIKEIEQRRQFRFSIYENSKKHLFQLLRLGIIGIGIGSYFSHSLILYLATGITVFSGFGYIYCHYKLKKWLKYMQIK